MNGISVSQETISPEMAAKLLEVNTHNRHIVQSRVDLIAQDITDDNWVFNGESIKFSDTGKLLDGQHRLLAIYKSGKSIDSIIIRGLPEIAQDTVDSGAKRTFGNILTLRGEANVNTLASGIRVSWYITKYGEPKTSAVSYPSTSELLRYFLAHTGLREAAVLGSQAAHSSLHIQSGISTAVYYHMKAIDPGRATMFWDQLLLNDAPRGSAVHALRESLSKDLSRPHRMSTTHKMALIIKAWNAWLEGKKMDYILWRPSGPAAESFPRLRAPIDANVTTSVSDAVKTTGEFRAQGNWTVEE